MKFFPAFAVFFLYCSFARLSAQYSVCGQVKDDQHKSIQSKVSLVLKDQQIRTNNKGEFCFSNLPAGEYHLQATDIWGKQSSVITKILITEDTSGITLVLNEKTATIDEVKVVGKKAAIAATQQSITVGVVDLSKEARSAVSVEQLMNRSAGIRVRNSGGLGAEADIIVGGFNGKAIKFLMDGIPVDYLGTSMGLTKIPTTAADYIEVYKGVMPTEIGVDALGGAINIVTKTPKRTGATFSYEVGSFNTQRFNLTAFHRKSETFSAGVNVFFNYSANNFKVDQLPVEDPETGRTQYISAPLFHNGYLQNSGEAYLNFEKRSWADLLRIKLNTFSIKREIQNDFSSRNRPFGGVFRTEDAYLIPSIEYKKKFLKDKLKLSQFLVFSRIENDLHDPLRNVRFDWLGNSHPTVSGSETGIDLSNIEGTTIHNRLDNLTYRGLFTYDLTAQQKLIFNVVNNYYHQVSDDLNEYQSKNIIRYNRVVAGLGYQYQFWNRRMEALSQVKFLHANTQGKVTNTISKAEETPVQNAGWSVAQSLKYNFPNGWLLRASAENTYRLPDQIEVFGDNIFIMSNLRLKPEKSTNVNIGVRYQKNNRYRFEVNTYMRWIKDLIRLKEVTQFTSVFLNLDRVNGYGVELEGMVKPWPELEISGNLTYNEFRFQGANQNIANNSHFIDARVSNMPFYFGNAMATYTFDHFFSQKDRLQMYWTYSYVHQYYLDFIEKQYEPDGFLGLFGHSKINTSRIIPIQEVHAAGFIWTLQRTDQKRLSISAEINNLFNKPVYNNFKMQSAGRSFSAKLSFDL